MVRIAVSRSETERHQTALRGQALTRSHVRTASPIPLFQGNVGRRASETSPCRRAGNAKRRARPPQGDGWLPDRRRGNRDPRALLMWPGCLPRRLQLVFTRSSGRDSLFRRCGDRCCSNRRRIPSGSMLVLRSPAWGPIKRNGVRHVPQRDRRGRGPRRKVSNFAVVVSAPVRRAAPQAGPKVRHGRSYRLFHLSVIPLSVRFHECRNFLTSKACCFRHR